MSLIASCKDNRAEPWAYLRDIFTHLPTGADPATLLPDAWLKRNPQHRWTIAFPARIGGPTTTFPSEGCAS